MSGRDIWIEKARKKDAEIERLNARNEFLEKVAEQAVAIGEVDWNIYSPTLQTECSCEIPIESCPHLAAWLKEKK